MGDRKFKAAVWVNPSFVLLRWPKERLGLNFGIIKFQRSMKNKIYRYKEGQNYRTCHLIEKGSYMACLKAFDRCPILTAVQF